MELEEFNEYIKHAELHKREKCNAWKVAIGLQAVDGLNPSSFLLDIARKEIEGEITIAEAELQIKTYHELKKKQHMALYSKITPQVTPQVVENTPQVQGKTPQVPPHVVENTPQVRRNTPQTVRNTPQATPQVKDLDSKSNKKVLTLIKVVGKEQLSTKEIMNLLKLKDRKNFMQLYLIPALNSKYLKALYSNKPRHPRQKYLLTVKGLMFFDETV